MLCTSGATFSWSVDSLEKMQELGRVDTAKMSKKLLDATAYPLIEETLATVQTLKIDRGNKGDLIQIPSNSDLRELMI